MNAHPKLALGTVQLGLQYGIRQRTHKPPSRHEAAQILETAAKHNIGFLDTAFEYGQSEEIVGSLRPSDWTPKLITKTPKFREGAHFPKTGTLLEKAFEISCADLRASSCHALLIHSPENLLQPGGEHLANALCSLKHSGLVAKIGVSIYDRAQLMRVMDILPVDIVQLPLSLADQRLLENGTVAELRRQGVEIHVRSALLQGALLMEPAEVPLGMEGLLPATNAVKSRALSAGGTPLQLLLRFALELDDVDAVVVGVNCARHLEEVCRASVEPFSGEIDRSPLPIEDQTLLNPGTWTRRINI